MKQHVYVYCYSWDRTKYTVSTEKLNEGYLVYVDSAVIEFDPITDDEVFKKRKHDAELAAARKKMAEAQAKLDEATDEYNKLLALEFVCS